MKYTWKGNPRQIQYLTCLQDSGKEVIIKTTELGCLSLSVINALEKDNGRAGVINHQFKAKCECRGPS